jgi:uncharacterized MAPEG superfamily protein
MTIPMWSLLGFTAWTVLLLTFTVGVYRWTRILTGRASVAGFPAERVEGAGWYQRSMRAHANCIENLPVFGAVALALYVSGVGGSTVDYLSMSIPVARVIQSSVHVCLTQTDSVVAVRFTFFSVQLISFLVLIVMVVHHAASTS